MTQTQIRIVAEVLVFCSREDGDCVTIKMNEKVMRLWSSTLTVGNLAMIFKLDVNQGIYTCCEEEEEIIIPTETGKWGKNVQAERAFHFAPFFDSCQSRRPHRESEKRRHFSILMKTAKS